MNSYLAYIEGGIWWSCLYLLVLYMQVLLLMGVTAIDKYSYIASKVDSGRCLRLRPSGSTIHDVSLILTERKINLTFSKT